MSMAHETDRLETDRLATDPAGEKPGWSAVLRDYARGAAGGLLVGLPLIMTMEMWWQGFTMPPFRLLLFLGFTFGVLLILEHYSGFRDDNSFREEFQDAVVALGMGIGISFVILYILHIIGPERSWAETLGKVIIESLPVSVGVSVAISQLGGSDPDLERKKEQAGFWGHLGIGIAGAIFFGLNIAVTEEPMMIAMGMAWWQVLGLLVLSFLLCYALVYAVDFRGSHRPPEGRAWWKELIVYGTSSYFVSLLVAAYLLWTFGRFGPMTGCEAALAMIIVLGLVTSLGAATANLVL